MPQVMKTMHWIGVAVIVVGVHILVGMRPVACPRGDDAGNQWGGSAEERLQVLKTYRSSHLPWTIHYPLSPRDRSSLDRAIHSAAWRDVLVSLSPKGTRALPSNFLFAWRCVALMPGGTNDGVCHEQSLLIGKAWDPTVCKNYAFWKCGDKWVLYGSKHG
jgi:hypothetical protein